MNNLPPQTTSFIGREHEIAEVSRLLGASRLLTLTGVGGGGKTRLALQVAGSLLDTFPDGTWFIELAPLSDPSLVVPAVARGLRVPEEPDRTLVESLVASAASKRLLLILDGCEHLAAASAHLATRLLQACPSVRILVTSREALAIAEEVTFRVPSLPVPHAGAAPSPDDLMSCDAVRLFVERAAVIEPAFHVIPENAAALARICRRLDGIPLALELAAAQLTALTADQIADRLDDRFRLLTDASRTALPRRETLRAAMDWSYDLLPDGERAVLRRASVFAGGFGLEAAMTVCVGDGIAADEIRLLVGRLVDKSLLLEVPLGGEARFRLPEAVRRYGRDRLLTEDELARARARHRDWYLALAERSEAELQGIDQQRWIARLEREHDNLREAIAFSAGQPSSSEAVRLVAALWWFWHTRGYLAEGRGWLAKVIDAGPTDDPRARARALYGAGFLAWRQGDFDQAQAFGRESLGIARALGNALGMAAATSLLEQVARSQGHYARAAALPEQSLAMFRELGDAWGIATALIAAGNAARFQGNYGRAREALEESLELFRRTSDPSGTAAALHFLALVARDQEDYARAEAAGQESVDLNRELGDASRVAFSLHVLGLVARDQGQDARAEALLEESLGIFRELEDTWGVTTALVSLGVAARLRGARVRATTLLQEGLSLRKRLGDKVGIAECLEDLAAVAAGDAPERAVRLLGAGEALRGAMGAQLPPAHRADCEHAAEIALARLGQETFDHAWSAGRRLGVESAVDEALMLTVPAPDRAGGSETARRR